MLRDSATTSATPTPTPTSATTGIQRATATNPCPVCFAYCEPNYTPNWWRYHYSYVVYYSRIICNA